MCFCSNFVWCWWTLEWNWCMLLLFDCCMDITWLPCLLLKLLLHEHWLLCLLMLHEDTMNTCCHCQTLVTWTLLCTMLSDLVLVIPCWIPYCLLAFVHDDNMWMMNATVVAMLSAMLQTGDESQWSFSALLLFWVSKKIYIDLCLSCLFVVSWLMHCVAWTYCVPCLLSHVDWIPCLWCWMLNHVAAWSQTLMLHDVDAWTALSMPCCYVFCWKFVLQMMNT